MQLKRSEGSGKKLWTGFFSGKVVAVNPTKEERADIIGYELDSDAEDIKYDGKNDKDEDFAQIVFLLQSEGPSPKYFEARFRLVDKPLVSEKSGKAQWVNQTTGSTWVDEEANLPDWFTHFQDKGKKNTADKFYREAIQGEANLYVFLRAWLGKVSFFDVDTNVLIDKARLFRNVDKYVADEYQPLIDAQKAYDKETNRDEKAALGKDLLVGTGPGPVCLATVYTKDTEEGTKMYQNLYQEFLGGFNLKKINLAISSGNWMNDDKMKKFYEQIKGEHGCKDAYTLTQLQEFKPDDHQQSNDGTFGGETGKADDANAAAGDTPTKATTTDY